MTLYNWIPWKDDQFQQVPRKKHECVIITELRDIWPEITGSQRLD